MAKGSDVLNMLIPNGGWAITGNDYEGIQFIEAEPITKAEFEAGFAQYDAWKTEQDVAKAQAKTALLAQLGITEEQAKLLLS
jgi:serine/threonine protein kinase HipA of HipAB toxin-antitoxin module